MAEQDRFNKIFRQRNPMRRGSTLPDDPDRPKTFVEYREKYPTLNRETVFYHFEEGKHTVSQVANWVGYDVRDFKAGDLEGTKASKSPRSHVRSRLDKLVASGLVEKDSNTAPVVYSLTEAGREEKQAILSEMATADAE